MSATIECTSCGAVGESNFSTNYFGELVCELCGTQSFLQARNETQDMEDTTMAPTRAGTMKVIHKRKKRKRDGEDGEEDEQQTRGRFGVLRTECDVSLVDCLRATQAILDVQTRALIDKCGFPDEFSDAVQKIWFLLLDTWPHKSSRPLLRCYTQFLMPRNRVAHAMDPSLTRDVLEQWDNDREMEKQQEEEKQEGEEENSDDEVDKGEENTDTKNDRHQEEEDNDDEETEDEEPKTTANKRGKKQQKPKKTKKVPSELKKKKLLVWRQKQSLDYFSVVDLLGILVLAARLLNLGVLPNDFTHWIRCGVLPFHNLVASCCTPELQESVADVAYFFDLGLADNMISTAHIALRAQNLRYQLEIELPPLNASLVAFNVCRNLGFPPQVFRNFQWIAANCSSTGKYLEMPLLQKQMNIRPNMKVKRWQQIESSVDIIAHLTVAVRMCPNWHEWIYERATTSLTETPYAENAVRGLPRRDLGAFVDLCETVLEGKREYSSLPVGFDEHVHNLRDHDALGANEYGHEAEMPTLLAYPAIHENGVCVETDDNAIEIRLQKIKQAGQSMKAEPTENYAAKEEEDDDDHSLGGEDMYFYPFYTAKARSCMHAAYETVLELLCGYMNTPVASVLPPIFKLDQKIERLCTFFEHYDSNTFQYKWTKLDAQEAAELEDNDEELVE